MDETLQNLDDQKLAPQGSNGNQLDYECPRCGADTTSRFYGPCSSCTSQLRTNLRTEATDVSAPEYEPKMNVTPNAVATKE